MRQLHLQYAGLNRVQAPVIALHLVIVLGRLAVVAKHAGSIRNSFIIGGNGPGLAAGAEIFSGIKAESCCSPHGAGPSPALRFLREVLRTVCLTSVLDQG